MRRSWPSLVAVLGALVVSTALATPVPPASAPAPPSPVELADRAEQVNERWDAGNAEYQDTLTALQEVATQSASTADRLRAEEPPEGIGNEPHQRLMASATSLSQAAEGMVEGLQSTDTGEARQSQLVRYLAAAAEFSATADTVVQAIDFSSAGDSADS